MKDLDIALSIEDIKILSKQKFTKIINEKNNVAALSYLTGKQNIKGGEIIYSKLEISEYLSPLASHLSITDKRKMFSVRNMMIDIPANFSKANRDMKCICGEIETMKHLYICEQLSIDNSKLEYKKMYN